MPGYVAHEILQAAATRSPDRIAAEACYLAEGAADGRHPGFAEVLASPHAPSPSTPHPLNRLIDGLMSTG
ncbi:hypothetical protein ABZ499_14845 [Streptomyces sp. NPDC019990]|uniref:hypothetical protein n=1 Tax=Streptomyces sp. NPDC019990 TaxID=3154693 RepID=UPI0033C699FF